MIDYYNIGRIVDRNGEEMEEEILNTINNNSKKSAYQFLVDNNSKRMNNIAIDYYGVKLTYKQFIDKIDLAAKAFLEWGVKKGEYVTVSMLFDPEGLITFYALNKIGAVAHMINAASAKNEIIEQIKSVKSDKIVTMDLLFNEDFSKNLREAGIKKALLTSLTNTFERKRCLDRSKLNLITAVKSLSSNVRLDERCIKWNKFMSNAKNYDKSVPVIYEENSPAAIAYTSGTCGTCKGVVASNEELNAMPIQISSVEESLEEKDVMFATLPMWIYYSFENSGHTPLSLGLTVAMDPIFVSKNLEKRLVQYQFQHWDTIPAYVEDMVNNKNLNKRKTKCIKTLMTGGDYLSPSLQKKAKDLFGINVGQGYGFSETLGGFAYTYGKNTTLGSVGKLLPGNKCRIYDLDTGELVKDGATGEAYISGPTLMLGYVEEENNEKSIIIDNDGVKWFKTGDLMHVINEEMFYDGRIRRIVITKDAQGFPTKIIPDKIKRIISFHPAVENVEVITLPNENRINIPVACLTLKEGYNYDEIIRQEINKFCIDNLPEYSIPVDYYIIKSIPKNSRKKNDIKKLTDDYLSTLGKGVSNKLLKK